MVLVANDYRSLHVVVGDLDPKRGQALGAELKGYVCRLKHARRDGPDMFQGGIPSM